jgi:hypothetical protein
MSSTDDLVTISAAPVSAPGDTGTFSLVANGQVQRIRPGSGASASTQSGAVELGVVTQGAQFRAPFSVLEGEGTALRARFNENRSEFFTDVTMNDDLAVTGNLSVASLSQFAGVEAAGVVAEQVVWVTGAGAPAQSIMFPGSLQLGEWRLRAVSSGQAVLEWFSSQFNAWRQVTSFAQNETTELETERLRAGTLLIGPDELGIGANSGLTAWVNGKLRATSNLETAGRLRTNAIESFAGGPVRLGNDLTAESGIIRLGAKWRIRGDVNGEFYLERLDDDGAAQTGDWYRVCTWGFNTEINSPGMGVDNLGVAFNFTAGNITASGTTDLQAVSATSLTVGGVNVGAALAASEPAFTAVAPLRKAFNIQSGQLELRVDSPFWAAGRVAGSASVTSSIGQVGFTVSRPSGQTTGVYYVQFASPAPSNDYVVSLAQIGNGNIKIWDFTTPTANGFHVVTYNQSWGIANFSFHFSIVV